VQEFLRLLLKLNSTLQTAVEPQSAEPRVAAVSVDE
jgi:hypothetical protein